MSALDAFLSTWSRARETFGEGAPADGAQFDKSAQFQRLQTDVEAATPDAGWSGAGADQYAVENRRHAGTLGAMAGLDKRLAVEVDRSAEVVAAGRRDLDAVKQWVVNAASTVPPTAAGDRVLWPVISKGAGDVADIIARSNGELSAIAGRIRELGGEYDDLSQQKRDADAAPLNFDGDGNGEITDLPETTLDLADIKQLPPYNPRDPSTFGPDGYMELVPGSGTWVPDPRSRFYKPTPVLAPLDLNDIVQRAPFDPNDDSTLGPSGYMELVPGSGTWVPDPNSPTFPKSSPEAPVDLGKIVYRGDGLGQPWEMELIPDSGVWIPNPNYGTPR